MTEWVGKGGEDGGYTTATLLLYTLIPLKKRHQNAAGRQEKDTERAAKQRDEGQAGKEE